MEVQIIPEAGASDGAADRGDARPACSDRCPADRTGLRGL